MGSRRRSTGTRRVRAGLRGGVGTTGRAIRDRAISTGADVVLVLPPPMISARVQRVTDRLRAEYQAIADRHPEVTLVDAATAVGGPDGEWVATRQTAAGIPAPVRVADTVHLADHGQALVAHEIRLGIRGAVRAR